MKLNYWQNMKNKKEIDLMKFDQRRVGVEFENPMVDPKGSLIEYSQIEKVWNKLIENNWKEKRDKKTNHVHIANKLFNGQSVELSTDGAWTIFEIALPPLDSIFELEKMFNNVKAEILQALEGEDLHWLGIGLVPGKIRVDNKYMTTKPFYWVIKKYWYLFNLNFPTAANQTGVSVRMDELVRVLNAMTAVSGLVIALTANSSVSDFKPTKWQESRHLFFSKLFATTAYKGMEKVIHKPHSKPYSSLSDYVKYFLDSKPFMIITPMRNGEFVVLDRKITWLEFLKGDKWQAKTLAGEEIEVVPEVGDLNMAAHNQWFLAVGHMLFDTEKMTLAEFLKAFENDQLENYLEGKLKNLYVEYRMAATSPPGEEFVSPALTMGLINNLEELEKFVAEYEWGEWSDLVDHAAIAGMKAKFAGYECKELLKSFVDISKAGLEKRGFREEKYLEVLYNRIEEGETPADKMNREVSEKTNQEFLKGISYNK